MKIVFTDRELDVMTVLWSAGSATVPEVRERLRERFAYNTVLTVLRVLEEKGYVRHEEEGRAYRYIPTVDREAAGTTALRRMLDTVFGGSPQLLLTNLVNDQQLSAAEIKTLRKMLDEMKLARRKK
jgi:BlaI family transcriptional regulator, penicillinase repressor